MQFERDLAEEGRSEVANTEQKQQPLPADINLLSLRSQVERVAKANKRGLTECCWLLGRLCRSQFSTARAAECCRGAQECGLILKRTANGTKTTKTRDFWKGEASSHGRIPQEEEFARYVSAAAAKTVCCYVNHAFSFLTRSKPARFLPLCSQLVTFLYSTGAGTRTPLMRTHNPRKHPPLCVCVSHLPDLLTDGHALPLSLRSNKPSSSSTYRKSAFPFPAALYIREAISTYSPPSYEAMT